MLLQAEQMHKMIFILIKMVEVVILSDVQLEISHMLNGTTPKIQHTK